MSVPPLGATGVDKSDPATFATGSGYLAPSSMGAPDTMRQAVSDVAIDRPADMRGASDDAPKTLDQEKALSLLRDASSQSRTFFESFVHAPWQRSYRAVRNEHFSGSLYLSDAYKARSKIFTPKTRSALRKRLAATAKAMFTPGDVVSVQAEDESNPQQVASASLKQELVNYRLGTSTNRNGIPWFLTASGARFDAEVTSICCSKQSWIYTEVETDETEMVENVDQESGAVYHERRPKKLVLADRPDIMLIPPENVRFDPNANWTNVAQLSPYLLLLFPMTPDEAWEMVRRNQRSKVPWLSTITKDTFRARAGNDTPSETTGPRSAREGGKDPMQQSSGEYRTVWLTEAFIRHGGRDYVFWCMNNSIILSEPAPVEKVYPWLFGERPVTIGMGQLEPHRTYQMSMVESLQQTQQESNDLRNLRLDYEKRIVSPPMKVLRGRKVDLSQVQRKGANSILMVQGMEDVMPMELPDVPQSIFAEANALDADMNDLSGVVDGSGTAAKDAANETLGGMHLLAESGNMIADFDMSVWTETWAQPTIQQLVMLEEYYETDERVLAICGQRAALWDKFGVNEITDELLRAETTARVNLGVGATSLPMERLKRFSVAWDTAAKALAPFVQTKQIEVDIDAETIVTEIFNAANFRDGGKRFFKYLGAPQQPAQPPPPDPKAQAAMLAAQAKMQGNQVAQEKNQGQMLLQAHKLQADQESQRAQLLNDAADRRTGLDIEHMKVMADMARNAKADAAAQRMKAFDHVHDHHKGVVSPFLGALAKHFEPKPDPAAANSPHGDPNVPLLAPKPGPRFQPQPGMFATLESSLPQSGK